MLQRAGQPQCWGRAGLGKSTSITALSKCSDKTRVSEIPHTQLVLQGEVCPTLHRHASRDTPSSSFNTSVAKCQIYLWGWPKVLANPSCSQLSRPSCLCSLYKDDTFFSLIAGLNHCFTYFAGIEMIFFLQFFNSESINLNKAFNWREPAITNRLKIQLRSNNRARRGNCKKLNTWVIYNPKPAGCPGGYLNQLSAWGWKEQCFVSSEEPVCLINNLKTEWDVDLRHIHTDLGELYWNLQHDNEPEVSISESRWASPHLCPTGWLPLSKAVR